MAGATYAQTLEAFTNFLTAYVHTLLYLRSLYPRTSFVHSRFHNTSVYQSRHPLVCDWIRDAIDAVRTELLEGTVSRIGIVIFSYGNGSKLGNSGSGDGGGSAGSGGGKGTGDVQIMERFMIDVSAFPVVDKEDLNTVLEWASRPMSQASSRSASPDADDETDEYSDAPEHEGKHPEQHHLQGTPTRTRSASPSEPPAFDIGVDTNLSEQMRAALISLTTRCAALKPLPSKCSFNIAMELKDEADVDPPVGHPQAWIPVQPSLQKTGRKTTTRARVGDEGEEEEGEVTGEKGLGDTRREGEDLGGARFTPIRTVETGTFRFETWVEEGRAKFGQDASRGQAKPTPKLTVDSAKPKVTFERPKVSFSTSSGDSSTK